MSPRQRVDGRALAVSRTVENLAYALPGYRDQLLAQIRALDGYGSGVGDGLNVIATAELTTPEAVVAQIQHLEAVLADADQVITTISIVATDLLRDARRVVPLERIVPKRCDATRRDGAIEWADPTCTAVPSRGPLCDRCSKREYRWRVTHGLSRRDDGVYSEPAAS